MNTSGAIFIHSAPAALCPHIEWAIEAVLGHDVEIDWSSQPAEPRMSRAEISWTAAPGTSAGLASALRHCKQIRFEVTEDPVDGHGERYMFTPRLGMFHSLTMENGDVALGEQQLRALLDTAKDGELRHGLQDLLGEPWDDELEPFRYADDYTVRWFSAAV
ncbi:DUF3145 domain-containing protein [Propionimicrobium lymphophilum]|uniref:DUF3145 domain-containing protein n=1 Tax=Propionimicrobium lymphophilum TaxID=33012 RepID=UPI0023F57839|nr:DUF3145 domain-containing protein [Propionimicrobium lymphophilum]